MAESAENPYQTPEQESVPRAPQLQGRGKLFPVAVALLVMSLLHIFLSLFAGVFQLFLATRPGESDVVRHLSLNYAAYQGVMILYSLVVACGAVSMVRRGSLLWAYTTSILAMVPLLGPCYIFAIPVGLWALLLLRDPSVKAGFRRL